MLVLYDVWPEVRLSFRAISLPGQRSGHARCATGVPEGSRPSAATAGEPAVTALTGVASATEGQDGLKVHLHAHLFRQYVRHASA